jgi:hypothetical protein
MPGAIADDVLYSRPRQDVPNVRVVPDLDPGPLASEHRQQPPAGSARLYQNRLPPWLLHIQRC